MGFSLKGLLGAITLIAIGTYAMVNATPAWLSFVAVLTTFLLLTAIVGAIYSRGQRRAFFVGCCVLGWGYLLIAFAPGDYGRIASSNSLLGVVAEALERIEPLDPSDEWNGPTHSENGQMFAVLVMRDFVKSVGRILLAWIFAALGGFAGAYFYARQERQGDTRP